MEFLLKLTRKKFIRLDSVEDTKLSRCLNTLDLTALGMFTHDGLDLVHMLKAQNKLKTDA
jgi:hypothetical protein